jgi:O-methyltransferase involved in polyketide biosynthesis
MSHPALASARGRIYHAILSPLDRAYDRLSGVPGLDAMLLARHRAIDAYLAAEIEAGRIANVVEVAAGLSPRGFKIAQRYPGVRVVEGDLPESAERKRRLLDGAGLRGPNHDVVTINALVDESVAAAVPAGGRTAIVTEGLLGYFGLADVEAMWRRFARVLRARGGGVYVTDLNLGADATRAMKAFRVALGWFARGEVHLHFAAVEEAEAALRAAGFDEAAVRRPADVAEVGYERGHVRIGVATVT